ELDGGVPERATSARADGASDRPRQAAASTRTVNAAHARLIACGLCRSAPRPSPRELRGPQGAGKEAVATLREESVTRMRRYDPSEPFGRRMTKVSLSESVRPSSASTRVHFFASRLYSASASGENASTASIWRTSGCRETLRMTGAVLSIRTGEDSRVVAFPSPGFGSASDAVTRNTYSPSGSDVASKEYELSRTSFRSTSHFDPPTGRNSMS